MSATAVVRMAVVLTVPAPEPSPVARVSTERLTQALLADAVDAAESLAGARVAVLCQPAQAAAVSAVAAIDTTVWSSAQPTVAEAADRADAAGAGQVVVLASDAPHLPGLLVGKVYRALGRSDVALSPDPRGGAAAVGLRLPVPSWVGHIDLDRPDLGATLLARAPRRSLVRMTPSWRRLREAADFAALDPAVDGADLTRALLTA